MLDIFSKRGRPLPANDVFTYDSLPQGLRVQIMHIWMSTLGRGDDFGFSEKGASCSCWELVTGNLARELGRLNLAKGANPFEVAFNFFLNETNSVEHELDIVEMTFRLINTYYRDEKWRFVQSGYGTQSADDAVAELNHRFLEHSVGYRFESGHIIRVDSTYTHAEVVKPTLLLLADKRFRNAEEEFLAAHKAYREGRYSDCLNECLKSFESTMKIICTQRKWAFQPTDTASRLIGLVLDKGLVPRLHQAQFTSLRQLLESGTPTVRNKNSGHGQGATQVVIPEYVARYALNTAAANVALLVEAAAGATG